jgi:hypothetical protein
VYKTLGVRLLNKAFCPTSAFVSAERNEVLNPQRFIHVTVCNKKNKQNMKAKIIFSVSILTLLLLSVGCEKELSGIEFGQEFKLAFNQKATITDELTGERLEVKFEDLIVDSRCPTGALCIWAGAVTIELLINKTKKIQITHYPGSIHDTIRMTDNGNYNIALIEVDPYPILNKITHKHDYVATLKIIK